MLTQAFITFGVAALGGLVLASRVLMGKQASWPVSIIHAVLGAAGLVMLALVVLEGNDSGRIVVALTILVVAALGGFYLASFHVRKMVAAKSVVIIHAGVAVVGVLVLFSAILGF